MSALHTDAKEVHQAYDEALKTCKYKVYGKERLLLSAQPAEEGEYKYYLPKKEEDLLKEALKCRNTRKTEMVIENVFADIKKTEVSAWNAWNCFCRSFWSYTGRRSGKAE